MILSRAQRLADTFGGTRPPNAGGLFFQQGTGALVQRRKRLVARNRSDQLVEVPRRFGFRGTLDLEQIGRMDGAAVGLDAALAEQRIVGRDRLHLFYDLDAVVRIAAER